MTMPIVLYKNVGLPHVATGGQTSTVGEPNVANRGNRIFFSSNWYATRSLDGGQTWRLMDPFSALPTVNGGFCCDQTLIYERSRDVLVWLLQYVKQNGTNTLRIAINRRATLDDGDWHWWDFTPEGVNSDWAGEWFDYNHAATSDNYLYVGTNVFKAATDRFTRSVLFRFPLDTLANASALDYAFFSTSTHFSLRCAQGARDVMYFGSHNTASQIRTFSWPEGATAISFNDVDITPWSRAMPYRAPGPDGRNWLGRCDPRITGAMVANGVLTFAWTANASGARPWPHVRVVCIDAASMGLLNEPDIWNERYALAYPALSPNGRGVTGITLFRGGGEFHPGHVVGVFDEDRGVWVLKATRSGSDGPADGKWGDYLGIAAYSDYGNTWFAGGYTLQGGGNRNNIEPRLVRFGYRNSR
jgi:hypothetical protein